MNDKAYFTKSRVQTFFTKGITGPIRYMENGFQNVSCSVFTQWVILETGVRLLKEPCVFTIHTVSGNFFEYSYLLYFI